MLHPLRPGHLADVHQAFDALFQLYKRAVVSHTDHAPRNMSTHWITVLGVEPRFRSELLEAQRHSLLLFVELENLDLNLIAYVHQVAWMSETSPRHIGNVEQTINAAHIHERTVFGEILHHSGQDRSFFQVLKRLRFLLVLFLFYQLLARNHDVAALLVQLDHGNFDGRTLHAIQVADGTDRKSVG